jgi:hypothetical protein
MAGFFDTAFFQQMVATAFGVGLGIPAGLGIDRSNRKRAEADERKELVVALKSTIVTNKNVADFLGRDINTTTWFPFSSFDVSLLEQTAYRKFELGLPEKCCEKLDRLRCELNNMNLRLELLRSTFSEGVASQAILNSPVAAAEAKVNVRARAYSHHLAVYLSQIKTSMPGVVKALTEAEQETSQIR